MTIYWGSTPPYVILDGFFSSEVDIHNWGEATNSNHRSAFQPGKPIRLMRVLLTKPLQAHVTPGAPGDELGCLVEYWWSFGTYDTLLFIRNKLYPV